MAQRAIPKRDRNQRVINLYKADPEISMAEVGRIFNLSRQRVSQILKRYKIIRICSNCYYSQDGYCSCRELSDIVKTANKCPDWLPYERS